MISEISKRRHDKNESSGDARLSCGRIRGSDETAVMAVERRDSVIYTSEIKQPEMGGLNERRKAV